MCVCACVRVCMYGVRAYGVRACELLSESHKRAEKRCEKLLQLAIVTRSLAAF